MVNILVNSVVMVNFDSLRFGKGGPGRITFDWMRREKVSFRRILMSLPDEVKTKRVSPRAVDSIYTCFQSFRLATILCYFVFACRINPDKDTRLACPNVGSKTTLH